MQWIAESDPDKLDAIANKLAAAAAEARHKQIEAAGQASEAAAAAAKAKFTFGGPAATTEPSLAPSATLPLQQSSQTQPLLQPTLPEQGVGTSPAPTASIAEVVAPAVHPLSSAAAAEEASQRLALFTGHVEPPKEKKRGGSRSPRRTKSSDNGSDMQDAPDATEPSKAQKTKTHQSARSAGGSTGDVDHAEPEGTSPQHFAQIADNLETQLREAGVSAHCS